MYCKDLFITGNEKQGTEIISKCFDKGNYIDKTFR